MDEIERIEPKYEDCVNKISLVYDSLKTIILGQDDLLKKLLIGIIANGNILLDGVPGLAKTEIVKTIGNHIVGCEFKRLQFTPDLLPTDIFGTKDPDQESDTDGFIGPVIGKHLVFVDEINRASPKLQSALLEAMEEQQITLYGKKIKMKDPFMVIATQNPIETEGTYPLPEAQLDRFLFKLEVKYPITHNKEKEIVEKYSNKEKPSNVSPKNTIKLSELKKLQEKSYEVIVNERAYNYAVSLVRTTRPLEEDTQVIQKLENSDSSKDDTNKIQFGASTRAAIHLIKVAKAKAIFEGKDRIDYDDVHFIAKDVLRHRIILQLYDLNYTKTVEDLLDNLILNHLESFKNGKTKGNPGTSK